MYNLLNFFNDEVAESDFGVAVWISVGAIAAMAIIIAVICFYNRKNKIFDTKNIVFAGLSIAASFGLSFIKIAPVQYGGSITLASMLPIMLYAYLFGPVCGLTAGMIHGLLQFVQDPYLLTPVTWLLDYPLAFCGIFFMGIAKKRFGRSVLLSLIVGVLLTYAFRFSCHLISGFIYFAHNAIWVDLPQSNAFVYSFLYNAVYLIPDMIIALASFVGLYYAGGIRALRNIVSR